MSHFTCLVIGNNPEDQLKPFDENLRTEFEDKSEEYKEEYLNDKAKEFYCDSCSSWGQQITRELYNKLKTSKVGRVIITEATKLDLGSYYKTGKKYKGYFKQDDGGRCKGDQWFEVDEVVETTHPDPDVCFEGKVKIRKISPPKEIALSDKYPLYDDFLRDWHGIEDLSKPQGYHFNPKAKWDWYQLGGRWSGFFKLKSQAKGVLGEQSWTNEADPIKAGYVDQAKKCDIDFDGMADEKFELLSETYDRFETEYKKGDMESGNGYFNYGVENTGTRENYIPETRAQFLERRGGVSTLAVLKDGEWYEKGEMGWFGCVSNEKAPDAWRNEFSTLLDSLPDDTLLSVYDCHI